MEVVGRTKNTRPPVSEWCLLEPEEERRDQEEIKRVHEGEFPAL